VSAATAWPGAEIAIEGSGLLPSLRFLVGGVEATVVESTLTRVVIRVPPGIAGGNALVEAKSANETVASTSIALQSSGLAILSARPRCIAVGGGDVVTLTGSGFEAGVVVTFGGIASPSVTRSSDATLTAVAPANLAGTARLVATNPSGATASLTSGLTYLSPMQPDAPCGDLRRSVHR